MRYEVTCAYRSLSHIALVGAGSGPLDAGGAGPVATGLPR
jgi:hypothetical protein